MKRLPAIEPHHRIYTSGPEDRPVFQIETLQDQGTWQRWDVGYSSREAALDVLADCACVRCQLATLRRAMAFLRRQQLAPVPARRRLKAKR